MRQLQNRCRNLFNSFNLFIFKGLEHERGDVSLVTFRR